MVMPLPGSGGTGEVSCPATSSPLKESVSTDTLYLMPRSQDRVLDVIETSRTVGQVSPQVPKQCYVEAVICNVTMAYHIINTNIMW